MPLNTRICVTGEFPPPPGGMALQAELLCENLMAAGSPVVCVPTYAGIKSSTLLKFLSFNGRFMKGVWGSRIVHVFSHSHISFFLFTMPPVILGKLLGKRIVIHYHGGAAKTFLEKSALAVKIIKLADEVIVPSGFLKHVFDEHGVAAKIIPNICNLERFTFHVRTKPEPKLIVARHLEPVYNVSCAIRAFKLVFDKYPSAKLLVAGSGSERNELEELVEQLGLQTAVHFSGDIRNEQMPDVYQKADIFLNTSNVDNMPVAILEAFACGLPVVSTRAGGIPYLVEDGESGLLADVNDWKGIAACVLRFLEEPGLAEKISKKAYESRGLYDRSLVMRQWTNLYEEMNQEKLSA